MSPFKNTEMRTSEEFLKHDKPSHASMQQEGRKSEGKQQVM